MRKSKQEAAETRQRIVDAASTEFRLRGIDGTGIADLMAAAGLTHGGFYKHFDSKEQVVQESLTLAANSLADSIGSKLSNVSDFRGLYAAIAEYLSIDHRDDASGGCPFVALGSELARSSDSVRGATTAGYLRLVDIIARQFSEMPPAAARRHALVMLSTMIGALTMARIVNDADLSASILRNARKHLTP
jgi:TetR/AcrR family transcriptional regulator, transcriptional repressor for nem operon